MQAKNEVVISRFLRGFGLSLTPAFVFLCWGCGGNGSSPPAAPTTPPLSAGDTNLIFVVSEDLNYNAAGDVSAGTANLTSQGLQRSLLMATFLQQNVFGKQNVTGIYALEPMTHLQTAGNYPDMAPLETIQQFSVLNEISLSSNAVGGAFYTGNNVPVFASYSPGSLPSGVAVPNQCCPKCQGLDFSDHGSDNEDLLNSIVTSKAAGFYVFSAPWETTSSMLANLSKLQGYNLSIPASYKGPNYIYAISIPPSGSASLATFNSNVNPPSTHPVLPPPALVSAPCTSNMPPSITVTGGVNGAVIPAGINTNETLYIVRHAEAHLPPLSSPLYLFTSTDVHSKTAAASRSSFFRPRRSSFSESHHQPRADAQVVLVVVDAVVEGGYEVVGLDKAHRKASAGAQVEAAAEVGGKSRARILRRRIRPLNQSSTGVRQAHQRLPVGLHGPAAQPRKIARSRGEGAQRKAVAGAGGGAREIGRAHV